MGRWKEQRGEFITEKNEFIAFKHSCSDDKVVAAHNMDCDAYEAQIAELQRRLDAVVARFDKAYIASKSESASNAILAPYKECRSIAEGRTE